MGSEIKIIKYLQKISTNLEDTNVLVFKEFSQFKDMVIQGNIENGVSKYNNFARHRDFFLKLSESTECG